MRSNQRLYYIRYENAKENDEIIQKSNPNDIWAHISISSAHGVICNPSEKRVPQTILKRFAA